ncbi:MULTISPECIES: PspC domain-containing protein [unclassified Streptococcus]|uniref:PspC domain-containing protein n=1 Tax=unclassified Streptococcus TaxID=2608887 RepID=UPI0010717C77|nr:MULTISPECIES: PspC domain-containing protein [unclassified Streptococcus]MBF0787180.1 PspC domain-containing protein [Streptococcus sp. 19428wC2_LYSM12]MCQ9212104.1 PspC domain-containing protein [Streptococcus sp. B01]MCQ9213433.1 PspC domain-containing protein [Streptococcus sp. O1]TFV05930.1 PspC domain-containing protein [Streptococcus sp. LYSM12]
MQKRLMRDMKDVKIAGVCSGIAKYFSIDPTVVRVIWVLLTFAYGFCIILYLICWWVMPIDNGQNDDQEIIF